MCEERVNDRSQAQRGIIQPLRGKFLSIGRHLVQPEGQHPLVGHCEDGRGPPNPPHCGRSCLHLEDDSTNG